MPPARHVPQQAALRQQVLRDGDMVVAHADMAHPRGSDGAPRNVSRLTEAAALQT